MRKESFWISEDGVITNVRKGKSNGDCDLTITFKLRNQAELDLAKSRLKKIQFSERSSLARIGLEIFAPKPPRLNKDRIILEGQAYVYDKSFPCARYYENLLKPGTPVGRLFYAPESQKLSSDEIWQALKENRIKLPNTISIDRFGSVFLTPHKVRYTLPNSLTEIDHYRIIKGHQPRAYLDKVQIREELEVVDIPAKSGILTSCSMYLKEHYVVLNRGEGNFGLHSGAVLLDPVKTFGSNVILEIYNRTNELVINPVLSIEVYHSPLFDINEKMERRDQRLIFFSNMDTVYRQLDANPKAHFSRIRPTVEIAVSGRSARAENQSVLLKGDENIKREIARVSRNSHFGYRTLNQAIRKGDPEADTLIMDHFPSLPEHIEILARVKRMKIERIVFRQATPMHDFFLPSESHSMLETYEQLGIKVYWFNPYFNDIYLHVYKNDHGYFIKEENVDRFLACTILAFYGSAFEMSKEQRKRITQLVVKMTDFFGPNVGILTGGGEGVMGLASEVGRKKNCLTGAAYLELEAQPPKAGVDFYNTFQEQNRHNRQKWFQVADFCIFNMGGAGTLEEIGIELCNLKLGIRPRVPFVFYHTDFFEDLELQLRRMIKDSRMPAWMQDYILFSGDPEEIIEFYRKTLQIM